MTNGSRFQKLRNALGLPTTLAPPPAPAGIGSLTAFSVMEFECRQGLVLQRLTGEVEPKGACLALAGTWLKEKRATTNGTLSGFREMVGTQRAFRNPEHDPAREEAVVVAARQHQDTYEATKGTSSKRLDQLLGSVGLRPDAGRSEAMAECVSQQRNPDTDLPVVNIVATLTAATAAEFLPPGLGVCVALTVNLREHAVAAYRSRGGSLHFFDPNLGAFKVDNPIGFFRAWISRYTTNEKTLEMAVKSPVEDANKARTFTCVR